MDNKLTIENLSAGVEGEEILHNINLEIGAGETHVLMGPNGAGKSTLGNVLMGSPSYQVTGGKIIYKGEDITELSADKRAIMGMFMSFQNPLEVPGLTLEEFLRHTIRQRTGQPVKVFAFRRKLEEMMKLLEIDPAYATRDLNVGFSGGEKKKAEILQMLMIDPDFVILDETDSGLDVDAVRIVSKGVREFSKREGKSLVIITHSTRILDNLDVDYTHVLIKGNLVKTGDASIVAEINEGGFEKYTE